jgi:hypothetical protein
LAESITLKIEHAEPLELLAVSRSLARLGQRYARLARIDDADKTQLYIKRITEGSLIVDLSPLVVLGAAVVASPEAFNTSIEFVKNLKMFVDYFLGKGPRPPEVTTKDCDEIRDIIQPVAVQSDGLFNIQATEGGSVAVTINLNPTEANAVQNRATREREIIREPTEERFTNETFYWQTADRDKASSEGQTPDRGIIESLDNRPRRVFVPDPQVKAKLVTGAIFENIYIVDGEVIVAKDRVQGYRITAVHDVFPAEDD